MVGAWTHTAWLRNWEVGCRFLKSQSLLLVVVVGGSPNLKKDPTSDPDTLN